jgi:hypothetical protein
VKADASPQGPTVDLSAGCRRENAFTPYPFVRNLGEMPNVFFGNFLPGGPSISDPCPLQSFETVVSRLSSQTACG